MATTMGRGSRSRMILRSVADANDATFKHLGLRFDRVAQRLLDAVAASADQHVPDGTVLLVAITAPIRKPRPTVVEIETKIAQAFVRKRAARFMKFEINGNRVEMKIRKVKKFDGPKALAFVHNSTTEPQFVFGLIEAWLKTRAPRG